MAIEIYRQSHERQYPASLIALRQWRVESAGDTSFSTILSAHGNSAVPKSKQEDQGGYVYVSWNTVKVGNDWSDGYPLVYDCSSENHDGMGINILMTDGKVIWDSHGRWLNHFKDVHPEFRLLLPAIAP